MEHPLADMARRPTKKHWMQTAGAEMKEKGTKGSFTEYAKEHGETVPEAASKEYNAPGTLGKRARFAWVAEHR
jgi:hypothetical protein